MKICCAFVLSLLFFSSDIFGQSDSQAFNILDKFAGKALQSPSVSMKFRLVTVNQAENSNDTLKGSVILTRDKYKLELPDNLVWFNGETSWSYLPAEKEVTINKADKKDNSFQSKPSLIFSMYKKGYKNRLIEEKPDSYIIDLYPDDIKSELIRLRLAIGKPQLNLISLEYKKKDGTIITLYVTEYNLKTKPDQNTFVFKPSDYKDVEVIDMR